MCESCLQSHQRLKATRDHRNVLIDKLQAQDVQELIERPVLCSEQYHEHQALEFYCEDCKVLICLKCSIVSHSRHLVTDTQKAALEQKMQMTEALVKLKAEILLYEDEIKVQTELKEKNVTDIMNAEKKMTDSVEEWIRNLREHEKKMKQTFRDIYEAEQKQHKTRLQNLELITTQLKSCVERGQGVLERNISAEILQTNHSILQRCDELLKAIKSDRYKSPYLNYLVEKKFDLLDQILVTNTDPSMCLAEGHYSGAKGQESTVVIVTRDSEGSQCYQLDDQIKVEILTPEGDHLETELKDNKDGKYTVTYTPKRVGQHKVEVTVNGQPLTDNPFIVQVLCHHYQFAFKFGLIGKRPGEFQCINYIAVSDKTGTIAVADSWNERIQLFSSEGKFLRIIGLNGKPIAVAFTDCGDLLTLVSESNTKLHLFRKEGHFIKCYSNKHLQKPRHLSIASDGRLIITGDANNKVMILSPNGNDLLLTLNAPNCEFYPKCAFYHQNKFYVSYPEAGCVKVFGKAGVYLHDIGCKGFNDGQFDYPHGLVIDKNNQLIVCDRNNHRLQLFTLNGEFLSKLQGEYFNNSKPRYVFLNNDDNLFVVDSWGDCIFVFHYLE